MKMLLILASLTLSTQAFAKTDDEAGLARAKCMMDSGFLAQSVAQKLGYRGQTVESTWTDGSVYVYTIDQAVDVSITVREPTGICQVQKIELQYRK